MNKTKLKKIAFIKKYFDSTMQQINIQLQAQKKELIKKEAQLNESLDEISLYNPKNENEREKYVNDFLNNSQNIDPNQNNFAVNINSKRRVIPPKYKRNAQKILSQIGRKYYSAIPINEIFQALETNNIIPLQEDGTKWSGFIMPQGDCGSDKANNADPIAIDLAFKTSNSDNYALAASRLIMTICTMPSGNIEIVAYLS